MDLVDIVLKSLRQVAKLLAAALKLRIPLHEQRKVPLEDGAVRHSQPQSFPAPKFCSKSSPFAHPARDRIRETASQIHHKTRQVRPTTRCMPHSLSGEKPQIRNRSVQPSGNVAREVGTSWQRKKAPEEARNAAARMNIPNREGKLDV
jgi:hypothetical protein